MKIIDIFTIGIFRISVVSNKSNWITEGANVLLEQRRSDPKMSVGRRCDK